MPLQKTIYYNNIRVTGEEKIVDGQWKAVEYTCTLCNFKSFKPSIIQKHINAEHPGSNMISEIETKEEYFLSLINSILQIMSKC